MSRFLLWVVMDSKIRLGPLAPWVFALAIRRWPRQVRKMNWGHDSIIRDDLTSEGTVEGGKYRALVHQGVLPDAWKANVEYWTDDSRYFKAFNGDAGSQLEATVWCDQALNGLKHLAVQLPTIAGAPAALSPEESTNG